MIYTQNIIDEARSLVGVKYRHGGRTEFSVDCAGLLMMVAGRVQYPFVDVPSYSRYPEGDKLTEILTANLDRAYGQLEPARVLSFWIDEGTTTPQHLALFTEKRTIIHSFAVMKKVVEVPFDDYWRRRLVASYSWRGVQL